MGFAVVGLVGSPRRGMNTADAFVVGSPAYFGGVSAQFKLVIDRSNCLTEMTTDTEGRVVFRRKIPRTRPGLLSMRSLP